MKIAHLFFNLSLAFTLLNTSVMLQAQELPRRAFLGIQMDSLPEEVRGKHKSTNEAGILISRVVEGSTAARAGFQKGDILVEFDKEPVTSPNQMLSLMQKFSPGRQLEYKLIRNNELIVAKLTIAPLPEEKHKNIVTTYGSVQSTTGVHRTILMEPSSKGNYPAILFIQGVGCYSIESPFDTLRSDIQLLTQLTRAGFVTLRVEKSNIGDSKGKPCENIDLDEEMDGYKAAFKYLENHENVDKNNLYIIGHSMGGVMAPLMAREYNVKGIIAYGTLSANFLEYFIRSRRNITEAYEMGTAEADDFVKQEGLRMARFMESVANEKNDIDSDDSNFLSFRDRRFWKQLFEVNIPQAWGKYKGDVLAAWGSSDYISTKEEHQYIAQWVNSAGGKGHFLEIAHADHAMNYADTYQMALQQPGGFNQEVFKEFLAWLKKRVAQT